MPTRTPDATSVTSWVADAAMAPSMHNAQPWRFHYSRAEGVLSLRMDPARTMPHSDPSTRGLHIGCGAALFNLRVAAAHAGWEAQTRLMPEGSDRELLAVTAFVQAGGSDDIAGLYPAVHRRHTSREPFSDETVPDAVLDGLRGAARAEGARLDLPGDWQIETLLELVRDAEHAEELSAGVREEISRWIAGTDSARPEGIPSYALGPRRYDGRAPVRDFAGGHRVEGRGSAVFERSPCLAVLGTREDEREDWLRAGQAMERVLLRATLDGLSTSLNSQALEWPELRWAVRDPASRTGHPQMLIRLGYGPEAPATPRRPVSEVLVVT
ncbi:nitroreductase [Streptomyces sp. WAC05374]|uniref:Acg family FMN-binding oxidoreductase n=1 Tax=Streptomyces sp. WAC05374 TaxID=2487420 RepID=UPI000F866765|nr:nitroreductase [Streptomyces sp. WAC05374]RST17649.1 nitroreductase [Streptomyces sp. WAC05374]TDF54776.1 nitroreductase [Streptomyces sp. WAC05374]TDF56412.1 nitroreductase [Streptomyces sp. WAC05374]